MKTSLSFLVLVAVLFCAAPVYAQVKSGKQVPEVVFVDTNKQTHRLSDYKGKYVVLEWFNPQCPFVKKHYNSDNMQSLQREYTGKGVEWISVDSSAPGKEGYISAAEADTFMKEQKASPSIVVLDPTGKLGHRFGAQATPHMFVINPKGVLIYQGAIDDKPGFQVEEVKSATNYVKAALDAAMAGKPVKTATSKAYGCSVKY